MEIDAGLKLRDFDVFLGLMCLCNVARPTDHGAIVRVRFERTDMRKQRRLVRLRFNQ
ncbi:hypothetical protein [Sedimentitalea sp. XS_ASV28]|uniref:hypothetical protein n=1 Tax=Sedimentitalea sp. XS_ASV28 TaxID=3241296 RepID=UPI0035142C73